MTQKNEIEKDAHAWLWIVAAIGIAGYLFWHFYAVHLKMIFIEIKKFELLLISHFIQNEQIHLGLKGLEMASVNPDHASWNYLEVISHFIGHYLMYPIEIILLILSVIIFKRYYRSSDKNRVSVQRSASSESENSIEPDIGDIKGLDKMLNEFNSDRQMTVREFFANPIFVLSCLGMLIIVIIMLPAIADILGIMGVVIFLLALNAKNKFH